MKLIIYFSECIIKLHEMRKDTCNSEKIEVIVVQKNPAVNTLLCGAVNLIPEKWSPALSGTENEIESENRS